MYSVHVCVCVCVRGGEVRNDERKKGKGESCVEMRWRRKMMKGSLVKLWLDGGGVGMPSENFNLPFLILKVRCPVIS